MSLPRGISEITPEQSTSLDNLPRIAATLLCARTLMELDSDRPSPAKVAAVENAISQAAFILEHIDRRWPKESSVPGAKLEDFSSRVEVLLLQSIFALYRCEAFLRDSRSLREDSRSVCGRERSVVRPDFAECGKKNRSSQSSQR